MPIRQIEIFSTGCPVCKEIIQLIRRLRCSPTELAVLNVNDEATAQRARDIGLRAFPAVVIDGEPLTFDIFEAFSRSLSESDWIQQILINQ